MKISQETSNNPPLAAFCAVIVGLILIETAFMQFVHYHSQNRLLNPAHYNLEILSKKDYKLLSDPTNRTVTLSTGRKIIKSDTWQSTTLPNYKPVNDQSQYALVTVTGTAPFMLQWYSGIVMVLTACIFGFFWGIKRKLSR